MSGLLSNEDVATALLDNESLATWAARSGIELSDGELAALRYDWPFWARPSQRAPVGEWLTWLIMGGRGIGKTRSGAEWIREGVDEGVMRFAFIGPTAADVRDVMVEGESGILAVFPPHQTPKYEPSKRRVTFHTGATATLFSSEEPKRLRGPQHERVWCDEPGAWRYLEQTMSNMQLGLRLGDRPRSLLTTTPIPIRFFRDLIADAAAGKPVVVTGGKTTDNADNLAPTFLAKVLDDYQGTRLGEQELEGKLLDAWEGALWMSSWIQRGDLPTLSQEVIAIDPAISTTKKSDESGIILAGAEGSTPKRFWIADDLSGKWSTTQWVMLALSRYWQKPTRKLIAETNRGGDMVRDALLAFDAASLRADGTSIIRLSSTRYRLVEQRSEKRREPLVLELDVEGFHRLPSGAVHVVHGYKGKGNRAEPVAALYQQGRGFHARRFTELEEQMTTWDPVMTPDSPDRLDAVVWAALSLGFATSSPALGKNITQGARRLAA